MLMRVSGFRWSAKKRCLRSGSSIFFRLFRHSFALSRSFRIRASRASRASRSLFSSSGDRNRTGPRLSSLIGFSLAMGCVSMISHSTALDMAPRRAASFLFALAGLSPAASHLTRIASSSRWVKSVRGLPMSGPKLYSIAWRVF
ncbi:hypothetical protein D3C79_770440 [compost metagenome]